jgi:hypothetical protein
MTKARRERRTFQPCPRHDGQRATSTSRVPLMASSVTDVSDVTHTAPLSWLGIYARNQ